MKLTAKQRALLDALGSDRRRLFCIEYVRNGGNGAAAARAVGYSEGTDRNIANELLTFPDVAAAVDALREPVLNDKIASLEEMRVRWTAIARGRLKDTVIIKDAGEARVKPNHATRMKADEMLARSIGAFVDRKEVSGSGGEPMRVEITLAEAKALAKRKKEGE